ncbi:Stealth CR1 domain-containing protein [Brachybacterium sp. AOP42-C2-15]|uniref:Stealth CR1 domain-containing protein n=1 Tax=Brachybacterium sp. AOP42-C2-15 TaxID=3457670 RepID=UPI0040339B78
MKLTYLLTTADARAGTEKAFADQTRAMAARGHRVEVLSLYRLPEPGFDFGDGVRIVHLTDLAGPEGAPSLIIPAEWDDQFCESADSALMTWLGRCDADVVITSTPALTVMALLACPDRVRIVEQEHRASMRRGITAAPLLRHGPRVDALVSLTARNAEWLREQWGARSPRMEVIPNALPATGRPVSGGGQKVVMSAGRMVRSKGFGDLIRAFAQVANEFPEWRLRIFGDGPQRGELLRTARDLGIAGRVELMPPTTDIEAEWARASLGALASSSEGLPLVLLEARGAGLPVIAYDCETGPREVIESGKDGFLVPVGHVQGLASSLRLLMGDEGRREAMSARAAESLRRFSPDVVAEQWHTLLEDLVGEGPSARRREGGAGAHGAVGAGDGALDGAERLERQESLGSAGGEDHRGPEEGADGEDRTEDGILRVGPEDVLPHRARERNRTALAELFSSCPVRCRPLRSAGATSWAVPSSDREHVLQYLVDHHEDLGALEVRLYGGAARLDEDGRSWCRDLEEVAWSDVTRAYLFQHFEVGGTGVHIGYAAGITLEFWDEDERRPGLMRSRHVNDEVEVLAPEQFDSPLFGPWTPMRGRTLWSSIEFPIDVVYTWVDGADPAWRRKRAAVEAGGEGQVDAAGLARAELAAGEIRFLNRDELRFSLRSLAAHLPWVRRIHLVTDAQRPGWLVEDERLRIVDHRELFPDASVLPVFNSHAIETVLHRIPGLSEHFLYLNDDGFFLREQTPQQYFTAAGAARFFPSPTKINDLGDRAEPHEAAAMNNRDLLEERFGVTITQGMLHSPHPHRRSYLEELTERHAPQIGRTRAARFRSPADVSLVSSLAQHSGHLDGRYVQSGLRVAFVPLGAPDSAARLTRVRAGALDYLTLGEAGDDPDPEYTVELMTNYLAKRFPIPSPWERR